MSILHDLMHYDDDLDKTYYDLSPFMNTNSKKHMAYIQKKDNISIDTDKQSAFNNYQPENAAFKGMVKRGIKEVIDGEFVKRVLSDLENDNCDCRTFVLRVVE